MQIEFLCSNCGKSHMTRPMVGIPHDLFIATCNDSEGRDMTATFWTLMEETP